MPAVAPLPIKCKTRVLQDNTYTNTNHERRTLAKGKKNIDTNIGGHIISIHNIQ